MRNKPSIEKGAVFGYWTVLSSELVPIGGKYWSVLVTNGVIEKRVRYDHLKSGRSKGAWKRRTDVEEWRRLMSTHEGIVQRCYNKRNSDYRNYGGRGISIGSSIRVFKNFYDYVTTLPNYAKKGFQLDRIDNEGGYEVGNLRWVSRSENNKNRRDNVWVVYKGEKMVLFDFVKKCKVCSTTVRKYLSLGVTTEIIAEMSPRKKKEGL